jgi:hypothetical protein
MSGDEGTEREDFDDRKAGVEFAAVARTSFTTEGTETRRQPIKMFLGYFVFSISRHLRGKRLV